MQTETTTLSKLMGQFESEMQARVSISRPSILERYRYFIESTDWDEKLLRQEKWIDRLCLGLVILSALYLVPILLRLF